MPSALPQPVACTCPRQPRHQDTPAIERDAWRGHQHRGGHSILPSSASKPFTQRGAARRYFTPGYGYRQQTAHRVRSSRRMFHARSYTVRSTNILKNKHMNTQMFYCRLFSICRSRAALSPGAGSAYASTRPALRYRKALPRFHQ